MLKYMYCWIFTLHIAEGSILQLINSMSEKEVNQIINDFIELHSFLLKSRKNTY
jgi:hypothetical protein